MGMNHHGLCFGFACDLRECEWTLFGFPLFSIEICVLPLSSGRVLQEALGSKLNFNMAYHPQIDGQSKRVIQVLEDMLRSCVTEFNGSWKL
ncbi:taxadiene 5-alpha hydroxylase [Gossypium australe]|uniref:Taxadiene 5-alpha hydroxylase n=1 Tax=Gossypium australe TaxID=47621 RepID=A0A5B6VBE4_9ROSI|nr:taxadiene 5-alpha hydroxylase [Gossypium australe]